MYACVFACIVVCLLIWWCQKAIGKACQPYAFCYLFYFPLCLILLRHMLIFIWYLKLVSQLLVHPKLRKCTHKTRMHRSKCISTHKYASIKEM